jgi:RNA polymerase sigma-70 factor (ECF subfamily)
MTLESPSNADSRNEDFVRLIGAHQGRIYGFVFTLVPRRSEAEELVQQISVVLWRKFDSFTPDGNDRDGAFVSWACGVAYYEVLHYLRSLKREQHAMSTAALERLRDARLQRTDVLDRRREALTECLKRLAGQDRSVIDAYYFEGIQDVKQIADATGRSVDAIYKSLQRIRSALHDCIESRLAREESE